MYIRTDGEVVRPPSLQLQCTIPSHHRNRSPLFFSCFYEQFFRRNGNVNVTCFFSRFIFFLVVQR
jgi:hypothetical protein